MTWKCFRHSKSILVFPDLFHNLQNKTQCSAVCCRVINKPPRPAEKQVNESKPPSGVESFTHCRWRRESSVSAASVSLRLVEVIPLQLASLWYEGRLRSEQWKTRPLRSRSHPHMQISPDPYQTVQPADIHTTDITAPQKQLLLLYYV